MRCYKLIVGEDAAPLLKIELNEEHPIAPRITFNIMQAENDIFVPSLITVFNLPLAYFSASQSLVNQKVRLYAGIKQTPTTRFCQIEETGCKQIFTGYIWNVLPDYDGTMCNITMYCGVSNVSNKSKDKKKQSIVEVAVPPKQSVGKGFLDFVSKLLGSLYSVTATSNAQNDASHQNNTPTTVLLNFADLQAAFKAMTIWGLGCLIKDNTVEIYSKVKDEAKSKENKITPKISNYAAQPTWTTTSTVSCSFLLDSRFQPQKTLSIDQKIAIAPSSLVGDINVVSAVKPSFSATSILGGDFRIVSVWHRGDSRGSDVSSWVTEVECTLDANRFTG